MRAEISNRGVSMSQRPWMKVRRHWKNVVRKREGKRVKVYWCGGKLYYAKNGARVKYVPAVPKHTIAPAFVQ